MAGPTRAWRKPGHTGRDRGFPTVRPADSTELATKIDGYGVAAG
jgi:hypothetical protein